MRTSKAFGAVFSCGIGLPEPHYAADLKGQCHEIFCFWFFSWISFPLAPEYSIKTISNFFEKLAEIFAIQGSPPVSMTPVANLPQVSTTPAANLPPVSTTPAANLPPVSMSWRQIFPSVLLGVADTGGKFATGVNDTGGKPWAVNISANFRKNLKRP